VKKTQTIIAILFSGICWYLSFDLSGNYWYLLWVAPIPVLLVSFRSTAKQSFTIAAIAYLIGRLSWLPYLLSVLPVVLAIIFTLLFPLIFALIILVVRKIVLVQQNMWSAFAFPVFFCLFEFIFFSFSKDGTAGSIAYTQANFLSLIQVASITGIIGISFLVTLFPSAIAVAIYYSHKKKIRLHLLIICLFILATISYGAIRINTVQQNKNSIKAGLAVVDEKFHAETNHPKAEDEIHVANLYAEEVAKLAQQGAEIAVLPEKMVNIKTGFDSAIKKIITNAAIANHIAVVAGYTQFTNDSTRLNMAMTIDAGGNLLADYQKVNLFEGEAMEGFVPGKDIAVFNLKNISSGVAICKDMDYDNFIGNILSIMHRFYMYLHGIL
jgi:apolipoprotein N-acyltransferase